MAELTPMMAQYMEVKKQYPDCILFYRLGDFYEMFFDDAKTASRELELTLTGRACGQEERAPMCGVPFHAVDGYLSRLVAKGYKVAICEQMEDPSLAKGLVKRQVTRIVSPGTNTETSALDEGRNNFLLGIVATGEGFGVSVCDVSTGYFAVTELEGTGRLLDEIIRYMPSEIVCNDAFLLCGIDAGLLREQYGIFIQSQPAELFSDTSASEALCTHFGVTEPSVLGLASGSASLAAAGALLSYLGRMQMDNVSQITALNVYEGSRYMVLDAAARRNLELTETLRDKEKRGTLLWVLDKTKPAMGARALRNAIFLPILDDAELERRYDVIDELNAAFMTREELREYLGPVYDLERLLTRIAIGSANPRDLLAFSGSAAMLSPIRDLLEDFHSENLIRLRENLDPLKDLYELISTSISEDAPLSVHDGGIIKTGFDSEVDRLRQAGTEGKNWLADLEARERESTGIKNLRVRYNRVFGYYIEVTNSYKDLVPEHYIRKQTLANAERFYTPELKELEETILGAQDRLESLEYGIFTDVRTKIADQVARIQKTAKAVAELDVYLSLAVVAQANHYCRPTLNRRGSIDIRGGRHPVVEQMIGSHAFVPNDVLLDRGSNRVAIITGPNMAGKSTYMRQTALICLMAQLGSFVPAKSANICISDRIFTRVGASDDLASGQSTFMVEMNEVANILKNATPNSLIILDEIGRGTSTYDGLAIAWSVVEHIANTRQIGAKTLFATHYHELTELEGKIDGVRNYSIAVKENGEDIVFLRKIVKGGADKSYGIQVARLAGLPESVLKRASDILKELGTNDLVRIVQSILPGETQPAKHQPDEVDLNQMSLFDTVADEDIIEELRSMDISGMTPLDALIRLNELQSKVRNRW